MKQEHFGKSIGFIPLRAGSKGIPGKNKKKILGRPLYQWVLGEAILSNLEAVYVFTDDSDILTFGEREYKHIAKVHFVRRSEENANDTASTEAAMIELSDIINWDYDNICLLQATSPLTTRHDINRAIEKIHQPEVDAVLSVVSTKRFIWGSEGKSLNYDFQKRPRRQDFDGLKIENGAVYITTKQQFQTSKNRLGGHIELIEMPEDTLVEIDEPVDFVIVENLIRNRLVNHKKNPSKVQLLVLDVDGVFTPGTVSVTGEGELFKTFSLRDGMGISMLKEADIQVVVITSEDTPIVSSRMSKLGIETYMGVKDKYLKLDSLLEQKGLKRNQVAYVGDDVNDLVNLCSVGWSFCPNNAVNEIVTYCDVKLNNLGGDKAIRECATILIKYNNKF